MELLTELKKVAVNESGVWIRDWVLKKRYPELASNLLKEVNFCPPEASLHFRYQLLSLGLTELPKCGNCGKDLVSFKKFYCSKKCANSASHRVEEQRLSVNQLHTKEVREKANKTCREKYGVDYPFQNLDNQRKASETLLARFGHLSAMQDKDVLSKSRSTWNSKSQEELDEIQKKREISLFNSNGIRWSFHSKESFLKSIRTAWTVSARDRRIQTNMERWGASHPTKSLIIRRKLEVKRYPKEILDKLESRDFWLDQYFEKKLPLYQIAKNLGVNDTNVASYFYRFGFEVRESSFVSNEEMEFRSFLLSMGGEPIIFNSRFLEIADDSQLRRQELDVYFPERKLAFEYNGIWYHDEYHGRDRLYHLRKTLECERLGIRLIHVWSDDWMFKRDCMISKILAILGKSSEKIFARCCEVRKVDKKMKRIFYEKNHIKGNGGSSIDLGLFYSDKLVACISFKDLQNEIFDLNRYATSCNVVGGFSKLLQNFKRNFSWSKIYTYADRSWSRGEVYLKSGFSLVGETEPEFYGVGVKRINRLHYTKELLAKTLPNYREDLSQLENLRASNVPILWGCGQLKFELLKRI